VCVFMCVWGGGGGLEVEMITEREGERDRHRQREYVKRRTGRRENEKEGGR
jgi:hypothetical protein